MGLDTGTSVVLGPRWGPNVSSRSEAASLPEADPSLGLETGEMGRGSGFTENRRWWLERLMRRWPLVRLTSRRHPRHSGGRHLRGARVLSLLSELQ